jgi:16S rRNA (guanine527-N7)-methyltransferase
VSLRDISDVLTDRASHARLLLPEPLLTQLVAYYQVLSHWNKKINLTSLSDPDEAVDRLLLEPVAAAAELPHGEPLIDLGSGGGSPAIPLALASNASRLVMVESRERKAAFLREVIRELGLTAAVETRRFEELSGQPSFARSFVVVSVRAVRLEHSMFSYISAFLRPNGTVALFRSVGAQDPPDGLPDELRWISTRQLIQATHSVLTRLQRST